MELATYDIDYRIVYTREEEFKKRVENAYFFKQSTYEPPVFHEILEDLYSIEMKLFVENYPELFNNIQGSELESLLAAIDNEDSDAMNFVAEKIDPRYIDLFARDLHLFLVHNHFFFFEKEPFTNDCLATFNAPLVSVW